MLRILKLSSFIVGSVLAALLIMNTIVHGAIYLVDGNLVNFLSTAWLFILSITACLTVSLLVIHKKLNW